jgi:hypothetical protein
MTMLTKSVVRETAVKLSNRKHSFMIEIEPPGIITIWEKRCQGRFITTVAEVMEHVMLQEAKENRAPRRRLARRGLLGIGRHA